MINELPRMEFFLKQKLLNIIIDKIKQVITFMKNYLNNMII